MREWERQQKKEATVGVSDIPPPPHEPVISCMREGQRITGRIMLSLYLGLVRNYCRNETSE